MYQNKYQKYKRKYLRLKNGQQLNNLIRNKKNVDTTKDIQTEEIGLYLFFDLLQVSKDIFELTSVDNFLILIGDTPSYLTPFLEKKRQLFNLPFSSKPFGCFFPPYSAPLEQIHPVWIPPFERMNDYFEYLDNKTILTRKLIKDNWHKIILIDSSSGQSIHGASIFFNRYIGNISSSTNELSNGSFYQNLFSKDIESLHPLDCTKIDGIQPLQFIELTSGIYRKTNIEPDVAKKYFSGFSDVRNYHPKLIIYIGFSIFYHREKFLIEEAYPRFVPEYFWRNWNLPPPQPDLKGIEAIDKLRKILDFYLMIKKNQSNHDTMLDTTKLLENHDDILKTNLSENHLKLWENFDFQSKNLINDLNNFFDEINFEMLTKKYHYYLV